MKYILTLSILMIISSCQNRSAEEIDSFFSKLNILTIKKQVITSNILNVNTTRTVKGGPYIPLEAKNCQKTHCEIIPLKDFGVGANKEAQRPPVLKYEPNHPDRNKDGYVAYPNINIQEEKIKLQKIELAIKFLLNEIPVSHSFFFSEKAQQIFSKFPAVNEEYNFKKLLEE